MSSRSGLLTRGVQVGRRPSQPGSVLAAAAPLRSAGRRQTTAGHFALPPGFAAGEHAFVPAARLVSLSGRDAERGVAEIAAELVQGISGHPWLGIAAAGGWLEQVELDELPELAAFACRLAAARPFRRGLI